MINVLSSFSNGIVTSVKPRECKETRILKDFKAYLNQQIPIQIPRGCLFKAIHTIDRWNRRKSILDDPVISDVLSGTIPLNDSLNRIADCRTRVFHLTEIQDLTDEEKNILPTDESFITNEIKHSMLTDIYLSAQDLESHFQKKKQPVYSMIKWGLSEIERGYSLHAILIFGIDIQNNILFWDVSDKLPKNIPRMRTMNINEFNERRALPPNIAGFAKTLTSRSAVYFYDATNDKGKEND